MHLHDTNLNVLVPLNWPDNARANALGHCHLCHCHNWYSVYHFTGLQHTHDVKTVYTDDALTREQRTYHCGWIYRNSLDIRIQQLFNTHIVLLQKLLQRLNHNGKYVSTPKRDRKYNHKIANLERILGVTIQSRYNENKINRTTYLKVFVSFFAKSQKLDKNERLCDRFGIYSAKCL